MPRILLINGQKAKLIHLSALLERHIPDCSIITALSGAEGLEKAVTEAFDTILLDTKLPDLDGFEICQRLKQDPRSVLIPVILFTASKTDDQTKIQGLESGAVAFLSHPVDDDLLAAQVKAGLRIKKAEDELLRERDRLEKQVEERTRSFKESETHYLKLLETSPDGLVIIGMDGLISFVSSRILEIFGVQDKNEVIGQSPFDWIAPEERDRAARNMASIYREGRSQQNTYPLLKKDGTRFWGETNSVLLTDSSGSPKGILSNVRDISERKQAAKALEESEVLLKTIAANYPNSYLSIIEKDFSIGYTSGQEFTKQNLDPERFIGKTVEEVFGEFAPTVKEQYLKTFQGQETTFELFLNNQYQLYRTVPLFHEKGDIPRILVVVENITERKNAEKKIQESEERYRRITGAITDYIYTVRLEEGRPVETRHGPGCLAITGYSEESFASNPYLWAQMIVEEDRLIVEEQIWRLLSGREVSAIEHRIVRQDGMIKWVRNTPVPRFDQQGRMTAYDGLIQDITERKRAEGELHALAQRHESLLAAVPEIVMEVDTNKVYTWANQAGLAFFGPEVLGTEAASYFEGDQNTYSTVQPLFNGHEDTIYVESWQRRQDGQIRLLAWWCRTLKDADGNVTGALSTARDITERQQAEEEIRRLNAELEKRVQDRTAQLVATNNELEGFSYSVSHDLRAPLRHLTGFVNLLIRHLPEGLDDKSHHYLKVISDSAVKMGRLIDDILSFSRMGRTEMFRSRLSLKNLADDALLAVQPDIGDREISWSLTPLPEIYGDPSMLRIVLVNLISNAIKFSRGKPKAEIEIGHLEDQGNEDIFYVKDNGAGFDMQYKNKLFNLFQRLHHERDFEGTGLGLAIIQRIIARHGGRVWAEGAVDQGATFFFSLPKGMG